MSNENIFRPKCLICNADYDAVPENWAVTHVGYANNTPTFNPGRGIPMDVFMCPICHELKFYPRNR